MRQIDRNAVRAIMQRITEKMLRARVAYLNQLKGFDKPKYSEIGSYTLDYAYGGVSLHRYINEHGAIHDVFSCGHVPKRELYNRLNAFISAISE